MKRTRRNTKFISLIAGMVVLGLGLTACGGGNAEPAAEETTAATTAAETTAEETTTPAETTTAAPEYETIGKASKDAVSFEFTNKTGKNIKAVSVITDAEAEEEPENLLAAKDVFEKDETCIVYVTTEQSEEETTAAEEEAAEEETVAAESVEDEKELSAEYQILLVFEDDSEVTLHNFPLEDIDNGEVKLDGEIGYLVYENLKGEKNISTLKAEQAIAETAEETPAEAVEQSTEAAAEPVYEEPVYEEPVYEEPVYEEPVYEEPVYEEPVYEEPAGGDTADDACVEDGLVY